MTLNNESKLLQAILELRAKLNEGSINQRQYGWEIGKLLVDVNDETLKCFDKLEQAVDDGEIDCVEYKKQLSSIFPQGETQQPAIPQTNEAPEKAIASQGKAPEKTSYDVFLSYSHRDSEVYGIEYILRIKEEIEKAREGIVDQPKVFLDVDALELGDLWHSRIIESLRQCKVFVCLVSEQYLKSAYSTRERLWWNAKQTHNGRLLGAGPYPVYYAKLKDGLFSERPDVKELMATQTDSKPWFEFKTQLQEDFIRERLESISTVVRHKARTATQAFQSFCSVKPPLCDNFVGRVTELRELHELCAEGKYPVIQAAGGVGKTELSVAYAYGFADQYPMGRFLLHMEGVHTWDDAFSAMLDMEGTGVEGGLKKVSAELEIDNNTLKQSPTERHHAVADTLLKRAQTGKLLILLDNLDDENLLAPARMRGFLFGSQIPSTIHVLATTRSTLHFCERDFFVSFELSNLKEDEAFEMLCLTGNGQYPFDMQPPTAENKEYQAAHEIIKLLDGHAWSMEILSAFMAENYDPECFTFEMELSKMKRGLSIETEDGTYRSDTATPEALLKPTLERLSSQELGAETIELFTFASCFNADNIPVNILEAYWQKYYPDVECSRGKPFVFALKQLTKYHLLFRNAKICKMHRLLQSVLLKNV
ncbi:MAG: toll/interleukin-1 receptor domain-containing protein, partial [Victivallales bacterium]|nr:toll/interleukin-1 receptor domain-containing protein [Victivallales bacterium]